MPKQARELHATVLLDVLQWNLTVSAPVYAEIEFQNPIDFQRISTKAGPKVHIFFSIFENCNFRIFLDKMWLDFRGKKVDFFFIWIGLNTFFNCNI